MVKVIEPLDTVALTYKDDRLSKVETNYPNYYGLEINQTNELIYGDYLNSKGKTENVLISVKQKTEAGQVVTEGTKYVVKK